jgi:hypothetical protein
MRMEHRILSTVLVLAWGVWFGAIVMVFVTVGSLFTTFADQRPVAGAAAAGVFRSFERLELIAAPAALAAVLILRWRGRPPRSSHVLFVLLAMATLGTLRSRLYLTPRIEELRRQGVASTSDQFRSLHRASTRIYTAQAVALLAAGVMLVPVIAPPRTNPA